MKKLIRNILFLMILITALASIGCDDTSNKRSITFTVTFSSQFNNTESTTVMPNPTSITVDAGDTVGTLPTAPSMSGYKFGGWWTGKNGTGTLFTADTIIDSDIIVYAYWYNYVVTFSNNGEIYATRGVTLPAKTVSAFPTSPTRTGYHFAGWYTATNGAGTEFYLNTEVTADITVYAYWVTANVYAITFNSIGGTPIGTRYVISPANTVSPWPADPTQTFYTFNGWTEGCCTPFTAGTTVTKSMTVDANWIETPGYTVTYNSYGGTSVDAQYVIPPATNVGILPADPTKRCYSFAGWYTEPNGAGVAFDGSTLVTDNITVYADWDWDYPSATYPLITPPLAIGDYGPSCVGKVFYIADGGLHGLEAAPHNWYEGDKGPTVSWINGDPAVDENDQVYQRTQSTLNDHTSTAIGTGLANSNAIVAQVTGVGGTTIPYAAKLCLDYSVGEGAQIHDDWYLPSKDELAQLYANRDVKRSGGFTDDEGYWSSSEYGQWDAWSQWFSDGRQTGTYKSSGRLVRPIRNF
ncbi:MAG: InlB B-repeat-containing protein [Syntrophaceae bacterium]|nr:InlB B-repeat-containing protein [Syntrophaceae bacterium]